MKLSLRRDGDTEKMWISPKWNNGDFDLFYVMRLTDLLEAMGEREAPAHYSIELLAVSPEAAGQENLRSATESCGMEDETSRLTDEMKAELLVDYGVFAPLWHKDGNNSRELQRDAREQLDAMQFMFGFAMDRPVNGIGDTGWDWIHGNIGAGLNRRREANT